MNASGSRKSRRGISSLPPVHIIILSYLAAICLGSLLLSLPLAHRTGVRINYLDALYTAASAITISGLTTISPAEHLSLFGQLVILVLTQVGGLGIMVLITVMATVLGWRIGLKERRLVGMDLNQLSISGVVRLARSVVNLTLLCEGIGAALLFVRFLERMTPIQAFYYAVFHSVSAFCNAGFDLFGDSLAGFAADLSVNLTIISLIILGGLGFSVLSDLGSTRRWSLLSFHSKVVLSVSIGLILFGFVSVLFLEWDNPITLGKLDGPYRVLAAFFQSVTTRSAGFSTVPVTGMTLPTLFLFMLLMFIGASPGSTGGGVKTSTVALLYAAVASSFRGKRYVELGRYRMEEKAIHAALVVVMGSFIWIFLITFLLLITEGAGFLETLFEVVSTMGTTGFTLGLTAELSGIGKVLSMVTMFLGRLGPIAIVLSLGGSETDAGVRRPVRRLLVG